MPAEGYPEHLTIKEFAELTDVGKRTVSTWINAGLITVKRGPGHQVAIPSAGVAEFLPPPGDALMCQDSVRRLTGLTKSQVYYQRSLGFLWPVKTPGGANRYRRSQIDAVSARLRAARR